MVLSCSGHPAAEDLPAGKQNKGTKGDVRMRVQELFDLTGQVAIITGGGAGLGRQMALALAEAGANVILAARKVERCEEAAREASALGARAVALRCDVTSPEEIASVVDRTLADFGRVDILVNNAGTAWGADPESHELAGWNKVFATNVTGLFLFCQAVGRQMIRQRRGKIINVASIAGMVGSPPEVLNAVAYSSAKGAVINLTRDLAAKWARHNIQVNAIAPGYFPSGLTKVILERSSEPILAVIPLGRLGGADDLKGAVVFLASRAADYVTGHILAVDGGILAI